MVGMVLDGFWMGFQWVLNCLNGFEQFLIVLDVF